MTNAPKRIWVEMPEIIDAMGFWQEQEYPGLLPYISLAASDARIEAAVRALSAERDVTNACNRGLVRLCEAVQTRAEAAEARVKVLEAAMDRIWDHCQNSGIEHATVGMRVIERVEDEVAGVRKDRSHE